MAPGFHSLYSFAFTRDVYILDIVCKCIVSLEVQLCFLCSCREAELPGFIKRLAILVQKTILIRYIPFRSPRLTSKWLKEVKEM